MRVGGLGLALVGWSAILGCGNGSAGSVSLKFHFEPADTRSALTAPGPMGNSWLTPPTDISTFSCLGVNVIGPGIPPNPDAHFRNSEVDPILARLYQGESCTYPGVIYFGISNAVDEDLVLKVPAGFRRIIQIAGLNDPEGYLCNSKGNLLNANIPSGYKMEIYELGRVITDLFQSKTVEVANTYDGLAATDQALRRMDCGGQNGGGGLTLIPDGTPLNGKIYTTASAGSCRVLSSSLPSMVTVPSSGILTEVPSYLGVNMEQGDCAGTGNCITTQCSYAGAGQDIETTYFVWDLSTVDLSQYRNFQLRWVGRAGHYSGSGCDSNFHSFGKSANPPANHVQSFRAIASASPWTSHFTTSAAVMPDIMESAGSLSDYLDGGQKFYMRVNSDAVATAGYCLSVQTDFVALTLYP